MKRQFTLFLVAVQFLTRLPVPRMRDFQSDWLAASARYFGLVGAMIGLIGVSVWWLVAVRFPPSVAVGSMMAATLLLTGALHEDGFADVCDGLGGGRAPEAALAIMKDSRIGAYGAIGIGMMLALKWVTLASLPRAMLPLTVVGAHMLSRWCAIGLILPLTYVRNGANGKSGPFAGNLSTGNWLLSGVLGIAGLLPLMLFDRCGLRGPPASVILCAAGLAIATGALVGAYFKRRLGGYTGDCLGAAQQLTELVFTMAALGFLGCKST